MLNFVKKHWKKIGGVLLFVFVAFWILAFLHGLLCCVPIDMQLDPSDVAGSAVQIQINKEGSPAFREVKFDNGTRLVAKTIAKNSNALSEERICVGVSPDMPNRDDFIVGPGSGDVGKIVQYSGNYNQVVRLLVYCDNANNILGNASEDETTLSDYGDSYDFSLPDVTNCDFTGFRRSKVCVVIVVPDA